MIQSMVITFESGPLKGKVIEVADNTLYYDVDLLPPNPRPRQYDPSAPVKTARLRYRRSDRESGGAVVFYAHAS